MCLDLPQQFSSSKPVNNMFLFYMFLGDLWCLAALSSWIIRDICPRKSCTPSSCFTEHLRFSFIMIPLQTVFCGGGEGGKVCLNTLCSLRNHYSVPRFYRGENIPGSCYLSIPKEISSQNTKISFQQTKVNKVINAKGHAILLLFSISVTPTQKASSSLLLCPRQTQNCSGCSASLISEL